MFTSLTLKGLKHFNTYCETAGIQKALYQYEQLHRSLLTFDRYLFFGDGLLGGSAGGATALESNVKNQAADG